MTILYMTVADDPHAASKVVFADSVTIAIAFAGTVTVAIASNCVDVDVAETETQNKLRSFWAAIIVVCCALMCFFLSAAPIC